MSLPSNEGPIHRLVSIHIKYFAFTGAEAGKIRNILTSKVAFDNAKRHERKLFEINADNSKKYCLSAAWNQYIQEGHEFLAQKSQAQAEEKRQYTR